VPVSSVDLPAACPKNLARVICVDKSERKLRFIVDGYVMQTLDTRFGGLANPTREGTFTIYRKDANHTSTLYGSNMPYAMFFSRGEAIHYSIDFATRGYNGHSHGCVNVRDLEGVAWLFDRVPVGTTIAIYP